MNQQPYTEGPTFSGQGGKAWRARLLPVGQRGKPDADATVGVFIVHQPRAHPFWDYWCVSLIHLREIDGTPIAHKDWPEATHEFMVMALQPGRPLPALDITPDWKPHYLTPFDLVRQVQVSSDVAALSLLGRFVQLTVSGHMALDSDFRSTNEQFLTREASKL